MAIDLSVNVKSIDSINPSGDGLSISVELTGVEFDADDAVSEFGEEKLLNAIGETEIIRYLENEGFTVTE